MIWFRFMSGGLANSGMSMYVDNLKIETVPEPVTMTLLGLGGVAGSAPPSSVIRHSPIGRQTCPARGGSSSRNSYHVLLLGEKAHEIVHLPVLRAWRVRSVQH